MFRLAALYVAERLRPQLLSHIGELLRVASCARVRRVCVFSYFA